MAVDLKSRDTGPRQMTVPTLAEANVEHAAAIQKTEELHKRRGELKAEVADLEAELRDVGGLHKKSVDAKVVALLGEAADPDSPGLEELRSRHRAALDALSTSDLAIEVLRQRLQTTRLAASSEICRIVEAEYKARVRAICEALIKTHKAQFAYMELVDALDARDVAWSVLVPMHPRMLGDARSPNGRLAIYLREAAQNGFIPAALIPEALCNV